MKLLEVSPKWKVKEEVKPLTIWEMEVQGRTAVKGCNIINFSFEKAQEYFNDTNFMSSLQDNLVKMDVVWTNNKDLRVYHAVMGLPGPISNREMVIVNTWKP